MCVYCNESVIQHMDACVCVPCGHICAHYSCKCVSVCVSGSVCGVCGARVENWVKLG